MPDEEEEGGSLPLVLAEDDLDRLARVKVMDDTALLNAYRALSNPRQVATSPWLSFLEAELRERGLLPLH